MKQLNLFLFRHKSAEQIGIDFRFDMELKAHLKTLKEVRWSRTHSCFYIPSGKQYLEKLSSHFKTIEVEINTALLDFSRIPDIAMVETVEVKLTMRKFVQYLKGLRHSPSTIKTYSSFVHSFLKFHHEKENYTHRDVARFIESEVALKRYSISTHRQCISALKHYFEFNENALFDLNALKRPKKSSYLPTVLSKEELIDLLRLTRNLKHRSILALIYSSGLRIGELINLELRDLDIDRRQILVRQAKGRKDRYVMMAESFLPLLLNYLQTYEPKRYFAEGNGGKYSSSAIRGFLKDSCERAKIRKRVTPHTLRHSFATHMLENGTDLRYIQELLGHAKPETTMIYTHVTKKDLLKIESPLDSTIKKLLEKGDKEQSDLRLSRNILG